MRRLTERHIADYNHAYMVCSGYCDEDDGICLSCQKRQEIIDRLASYEDSGIEPDEIGRLIATNQTLSKKHAEMWKDLERYLKAEADGCLMVLPCKVGDFLYEVDLPEYGVIVCEVLESLYINKHKAGRKDAPVVACGTVTVEVIEGHGAGSCYDFEPQDFGKTVFLTREEAEKELRAKR